VRAEMYLMSPGPQVKAKLIETRDVSITLS